jgi:hypothetical protein
MQVKTLSGSIYTTLNIDTDKEYKYKELKEIFSDIESEKHFGIIQNNEQIYNDLYDIMEMKSRKFKLTNLTIVFFEYPKEDTEKIISKCTTDFLLDKYEYFIPNNTNNLTTEFELSTPNLEDDELFMLYCVNISGNLLYYASERLKSNIKLINYAFKNDRRSLQYISDKLKDDENIINKYHILEYASERLKDKENFVLNHIIKFSSYFQYISSRLKNNKRFILKLLEIQKKIYIEDELYLSHIKVRDLENLVNDKDIVLKCLEIEKICYDKQKYFDSDALNFIGDNLKQDRDIIKLCLEIDGSQLCYMPYNLDRELILTALNSGFDNSNIVYEYTYIEILDYVPEEYKNDKEIVISAIKRNGNNFLFASKELRDDIEVIVEAINNCYHDINRNDGYYIPENIIEVINQIENHIEEILNHSKYNKKDLPKEILCAHINKIQKQYKINL